jgi:hypothetical protein
MVLIACGTNGASSAVRLPSGGIIIGVVGIGRVLVNVIVVVVVQAASTNIATNSVTAIKHNKAVRFIS